MVYDNHTPPTDTPNLPRILPWPGSSVPERPLHNSLPVEACVDLGRRLRSCYGPGGLAKSFLFHFPQGFSSQPVSSPDTASVLTHMKLKDPQAPALDSFASTQAKEHGDGAALVLFLASSLLSQARELLGLGVTGAEIQEGYRKACDRTLLHLEGMGCGRLADPREEVQVRDVLRGFLASWQPGLEALLGGVVAKSCVHSWRPLTSGVRGEVWEGVTFDPSCVRVRAVLERESITKRTGIEDGEMEGGGMIVGEDEREVSEEKEEKEEERVEARDEKGSCTENTEKKNEEETEGTTERKREEEDKVRSESHKEDQTERQSERQSESKTHGKTENKDPGEKKAWTQKENQEKRRAIKKRHEDSEEEEDRVFSDWVDLGLEVWAASVDENRAAGVEWTEEMKERETITTAKEIDGVCKDLLSVHIHGSVSKLRRHFSSTCQKHKHTGFMHSVKHKRRLHRPQGGLTSPAPRPPSYHNHGFPRKTHPSPRQTHPVNPDQSLPLQASVVVEEPLDGEACSKVTVTLRSSDQTLLDSAEQAVAASLRVYCSLLTDPRVVPGAGASEVSLAVGLTQYGLSLVGMEQLVVHAFAQALLEPVKTLGENTGTPSDLATLRGCMSHWVGRGEKKESPGLGRGVVDSLGCKASAIQRATEASLTILTDQLDLQSNTRGGQDSELLPKTRHTAPITPSTRPHRH